MFGRDTDRLPWTKAQLRGIFTVTLILAIAAGMFAALWSEILFSPDAEPTDAPAAGGTAPLPGQDENTGEQLIEAEALHSRAAVLVRLEDGRVLFEKQPDLPIYPASLVKLMTALVAVEHLPDLGAAVVVPPAIFDHLYAENAALAGFLPGEEVPALQLLYGALLSSGAECCETLALATAGSREAFVALMNEKAEELGLAGTQFANTTGLDDDNQYTTVRDMARLLAVALENPVLRDILTTPRYRVPPTDLRPEGLLLESTLFAALEDFTAEASAFMEPAHFAGGEILGGKTGYTPQAGLCLASLAQKEERQYILVTAGVPGDPPLGKTHVADTIAVYESIPTGEPTP